MNPSLRSNYLGSVGESWPAPDQFVKTGLYIVVRADLTIGQQMAQIGHAAYEFGRQLPGRVGEDIYVLAAPDEPALRELVGAVAMAGASLITINDADLGGSLTAAAMNARAAKVLKRLPLAGAQPPGAAASCGGAIPGPPGI